MTKTPKRSGDLANGETIEGEPAPPTSRDSVANALDRWDEEGGAPAVSWPLPYEPSDLLDVERRVLECLGAALICLLTFSAGSSSTRRRENHMMLPY
jgi:hypothetical protein